jgi:hypothetical protein
MRTALKDPGATCPDQQGTPPQTPTARWVFHDVVGMHLLLIPQPWPLVITRTEAHQPFLHLLGHRSAWFSRCIFITDQRLGAECRWQESDIDHQLTKTNDPWTNGPVERMNRTLKEATVKKYHYQTHDYLKEHLHAFLMAYNVAKHLKTLKGLTSYEYICQCWQKEPERFTVNPFHHILGLRNYLNQRASSDDHFPVWHKLGEGS